MRNKKRQRLVRSRNGCHRIRNLSAATYDLKIRIFIPQQHNSRALWWALSCRKGSVSPQQICVMASVAARFCSPSTVPRPSDACAHSDGQSLKENGCQLISGRLRRLRCEVQFKRISSPVFSNFRAGLSAAEGTELDAISAFSEIVPDTVIFDDFERFPPTAATVSSSLILGITSLPEARYSSAIDSALAYGQCYKEESNAGRLSCFLDKALVNVGADLARLVPGRVSTEVDARLAYDTAGIVKKVHHLLRLYDEVEVPRDRLLFKIAATWQGIEAARNLEADGIQTHITFVHGFTQASAAAQVGASVIQIFIGRIRDWARNHTGDQEIEAALQRGEDPGVAVAAKAYNYIHKQGYKSKLMAAAVRNKQDVFSLLGLDYLVVPLKVLQSLKASKADLEDKYSYARRLAPAFAQAAHFHDEELEHWTQNSFATALGPAAAELLERGLEGYVHQTKRVEEHFSKIWPPPNV